MSTTTNEPIVLSKDDHRMIENLFCGAWPILVQHNQASDLKAAAESTVAALVVGVTALRKVSGSTR